MRAYTILEILVFLLLLNTCAVDWRLAAYMKRTQDMQEQVDSLQKQINFMVE